MFIYVNINTHMPCYACRSWKIYGLVIAFLPSSWRYNLFVFAVAYAGLADPKFSGPFPVSTSCLTIAIL